MRKRNPQAFDDWYGVPGVYVLYNEVNGKIYKRLSEESNRYKIL